MKPEKEGHDSFNHIIRQAIVQDPLLSFSRAGEKELPFELWKSENADMNEFKEASNPSKDSRSNLKGTKSSTEQIQALRIPEAVLAFAQAAARANGEPEKYLPGWPLLSAPKILLQKCEKCSREFCSTINYRRHVLVHRRSLNIDKDFPRNREYLGAFWDKLSLDEGKDILSFTNMTLEEVNGSSIIKSLSSWIKKPLFSSLPQAYVKAGSVLLDMLQEKPASSQLSSKELFNVLDDASEKTFLCTGTVVSLQKFVFDGEVSTIALDMKNLIACISFMLEQKLVRAWLADKDAEALRCHKLLMEEEEAAQRRQAELKERKRLKKLRQKEQKSKDLFQAGNQAPSPTAEKSHFHGTSSPRSSSLSNLYTQEISEKQNERICSVKPTVPVDHIVATDIKTEVCTAVDQNIVQHQMIDRHPNSSQHLFPRPKRATRSSISVEAPAVKASVPVRYGLYKDPKATSSAIGHKIWTRKNKNEEVPHSRKNKILQEQSVDVDSSEVIIGSICIALGNSDITSHQGKLTKPRTRQSNGKPLIGMLWKPVGHHESRDDKAIFCNFREDDLAVSSCDFSDRVSHNEINFAGVERIGTTPEANQGLIVKQTNIELLLLESNTFRAFLAQRWKEAIAADHVKLVLSSETEASDCCDSPESGCFEAMPVGDSTGRGVSGALDKGLPGVGFVETFISPKPKFRTKPEKNCKLKYVPKLRNNTPGE